MLEVYNTKSRKQEVFKPLKTKKIKVYTCGPTLYQTAHIGNMRAYVFADTLNRTLRVFGYIPKHVINFTDVGHLTDDADSGEDKIEKEAREKKENADIIIKRLAQQFKKDLKRLNIVENKYVFPFATKHINEQIELIKQIEKLGYTYKISDGIYFDTGKYTKYGVLGKTSSAEFARIDGKTEKRNNEDFALWKFTPEGVKRQQEWNSPWGKGFPGWHIECSAMAMKILGEQIDIHTGGMDHITIHHNNEIAQTECVTNKSFSKYWMHVAFLTNNKEKFSKSLQNTYTVDDIIEKGYKPGALRYLFLQANYRTPLSFSFEALQGAQTALENINKTYQKNIAELNFIEKTLMATSHILDKLGIENKMLQKEYKEEILESIADDLNTPKVLSVVQKIIKDSEITNMEKIATMKYADKILGILEEKPVEKKISKEVLELKLLRDKAKLEKRYDEADKLRGQIEKLGYSVNDTKDGTEIV